MNSQRNRQKNKKKKQMRRITQNADTEKLKANQKRKRINESTYMKNVLMVNATQNISKFLICQNPPKKNIIKIFNNYWCYWDAI